MLNLDNIIQSVAENIPLNQEHAKEILSLEAFREHVELLPRHLQELIVLCTNPQHKLDIVAAMVGYVAVDASSRFSKLIDTVLLTDLACIDATLANYIFSNNFCLDLFLNDIHSFPTYFLKLCEFQTDTAYAFPLPPFNIKSLGLHSFLNTCPGYRSIQSQIISYADNLSVNSGRNFFEMWIHLNGDSLISGDDGKENFAILIRSKICADHLALNLLHQKTFEHDIHSNISYADIINIAKMHNDLAQRIIEHFIKKIFAKNNNSNLLNIDEVRGYIETLLPYLENAANRGYELSQLALAKLLFMGITSKGQALEEAQSTCLEIFGKNSINESKKAASNLLWFADLYSQGADYVTSKIEKDIEQALAIYQFLSDKASDDVKERAIQKLNNISLLLEVNNSNSEFLFNKYINMKRPNWPSLLTYQGMEENNKKKLIQYYQENFQYSQLKYQLALWVGNIINEQAIAPNTVGIYLDIAKKCMGNNLQTIAVKLLLRINNQVSTSLANNYAEISYDLFLQLIGTGNFSQAVALLRCIPRNSSHYVRAQKYLQFANPEFRKNDLHSDQQLSKKEIIQICQVYYEDAYLALEQSLQMCSDMYLYHHTACINEITNCKNIQEELTKIMNNCNQELLSLSHGHIDPEKKRTTFWSESSRQSLPIDLKDEILSKHKLLDASLRTDSIKPLSVASLRKFGFKAANKLPASKWIQRNNDEWNKVDTTPSPCPLPRIGF
jgi:hypothetical protein